MAGSSEPAFSFLAQLFGTKRSLCSIDDYSSILQQPLSVSKAKYSIQITGGNYENP